MNVIKGHRDKLENEITDLVLESFKTDSTLDHAYLLSQVERLEPQGQITLVFQQSSLPHNEK